MLCIALLPFTGHAFEGGLEKELQDGLEQSRAIIISLQSKLRSGDSPAREITRLKNTAENIRITHLLLEERFRLREERVTTLGSSALERQREMAEGYGQALTEYLSIIDGLPSDGSIPQSAIRNLQTLLDKLVPKKKRPIIGSLPYKHLNLPAIEPTAASAITPAYKGGNKTVSLDDTAATPEAPISKEIASLAQSLGWNPVSIYEYVKNNVETEWYWGCMKGAEDTLHQKSGNDCDQATLLVSLLRASGYPTRYVRGVIEFFPDIERAKHLTGIDNPSKIAEFFQKAGIPSKPIIQGGKIANFQIEHVWVESQIPYSNYRGNLIDEHGKAWLGLDTSIKVKGYEYGTAKDIYELSSLSDQLPAISDEYLGLVQSDPTYSVPAPMTVTPLDYFKAKLSAVSSQHDTELTADSYKLTRTLLPEIMNILPASLQFGLVKATNEYTAVPDELKHKVKLSAVSSQMSANGGKLFDITLDAMKLSNQKIAISYEPETVQDQEIIDSYGGLDNTPAYLVRLRPVLKVNGERIVVATDGLPMGADLELSVELISPNGTEKISNTLIVGNLTVIGVTAQKAAITPSPLAGLPSNAPIGGEGAKDAERILYETASHYIDRWNKAEDELASLLHLAIARPLPTIVTVGGVIDVSYLLDMPHGFTWKGVYVDADLRRIEAVRSAETSTSPSVVNHSGSNHSVESFGGGSEGEREKLFMQLSSLQGSVLEHRLFEEDFQVESISTAKLFQLVNSQPGTSILTIDKTNIDAILPTIDLAENIKEDIQNAVNQNYTIRIPHSALTYHDWSGIGYVKENPGTGESGWMLSGMLVSSSPDLSGIAGGSTVDAVWLNNLYLQQTLSTPYAGDVNHDPLAGVRLYKIPATDKQNPKTVGTALLTPFAAAVLDGKNLPVVGATVTFRIIAGGGTIQCLNQTGAPAGPPSESRCDAPTSNFGIARAKLTLGVRTDANADYMKLGSADENYTQIGLNLVTASAQGHSGSIAPNSPFEAYGKPDVPTKIVKVYPLQNVYVLVNNPAGTLHSRVTDTHGNPVSNVPLTFKVQEPVSNNPAIDPLPVDGQNHPLYTNLGLFTRETCTNPYPVAGDCALSSSLTVTTQYFGSQVNTILGNTLNTHYTVKASAAGLEAVTYDLYSQGTRGNAKAYVPSVLMLWSLGIVNEKGEPVNAAKAGTELKAPLMAKMFLLRDELWDEHLLTAETCTRPDSSGNTVTFTGYSFVSKGTFTIRPINNGTVTFTAKQGEGTASSTQSPGNGQYLATYQTGSAAAKNIVEADGSALVTIPEVFGEKGPGDIIWKTRCLETPVINQRAVTLQHGQYAVFDKATNDLIPEYATSNKPTYTAYGVKTDLTIQPSIIFLNDIGYTMIDTKLTYTIEPSDYWALRADLDAYSAASNTTEIWDGYVVADAIQGQGTVVFVAGTPFDITKIHKEQVVLNRGTDMEIKGEKKNIPVAQITVKTDESTPIVADEIKFGDGSDAKKKKRYRIELKTGTAGCTALNPLFGTINTILKNDQTATPAGADYYPAQYDLTFNPAISGCSIKVNNKLKFIVSNLSKTDLNNRNSVQPDTEVIYGGVGGRERIELGGAKLEIPIEPVGVIVLGIDGLRQDVLYPAELDEVQDGGQYRIDIGSLSGLKQVLAGYDQPIEKQLYVMLPKVTAIFPSVTLASWASIFAGRMPGPANDVVDDQGNVIIPRGTGILGNEFFARDLAFGVPYEKSIDNPRGLITFDSGASQGYDAFSKPQGLYYKEFFIPYQFSWDSGIEPVFRFDANDPADPGRSPQNDPRLFVPKTVYEYINEIPGVKEYYDAKGGNPVVVSYSHYSRGAYWVTWDTPFPWGESNTMDKASSNKFVDYLQRKYATIPYTTWLRNKTPFSALTVWYLPGLDHQAHIKGMDTYKSYFQITTDDYVKRVVSTLKGLDEFDNKIFIIVADHGTTAMPMQVANPDTGQLEDTYATCSQNLNLKSEKSQAREKNLNNNLHIWELGEVFDKLSEKMDYGLWSDGVTAEDLDILTPREIAKVYKDSDAVAADIDLANVIAAFNGPMAHIYVKASPGWGSDSPEYANVENVAEVFRLFMQVNNWQEAEAQFGLAMEDYYEIRAQVQRLNTSIDTILIRQNGSYKIYNGKGILPGALTFGGQYIDAMNRIAQMNNAKRSGDIVLIFRDSTAGDAINRYTSGVACKSWHGSLSPSDSYVPFILAYPGGNKNELDTIKQKVCASANCGGNWALKDFVMEIIGNQYTGQ